MRKPYLDNIRNATVLLVLVYHVFYMFNAAGVAGSLGSFSDTQPQDAILSFVYPWFMILLFVISGICARYSLEKSDKRTFVKARTLKLLVPSTLGLFVFQWIVGYFNVMAGGALDTIPTFIRYPIFAISGVGPLWFIQMLWLFSLILTLIHKRKLPEKLYTVCEKCKWPVILAFSLLVWGGSQILNTPVLTTYRFGVYFVAFLIGYFVLSHDSVQDRIEKMHLPLLIVSVIAGCVYVAYYWGENYSADACLKSLFTNLYAWSMVLAILGCGKAWCNKSSSFTKYMNQSGFGIYIVHYLLVIAPCYLLKNYTSLPAFVIYIICIILVLVISPLLYELLRRIPFIRYTVLGIKKPKCIKDSSSLIQN